MIERRVVLDQFIWWRFVMKHIRMLASILCACFVPMAWAQQPASMNSNNWSEFHRTNMMRGNPWEKVLNVKNVRQPQLEVGAIPPAAMWFPRPPWRMG